MALRPKLFLTVYINALYINNNLKQNNNNAMLLLSIFLCCMFNFFIILRVMIVSAARSAMSIFVFLLYLAFSESYPGSPKFQYSSISAAENLCSEYKSYFQSLNDAMNNNFVHCSGSTANGKAPVVVSA